MKKIESTAEISLIDLIKLLFKNIFSIIYFTVVGLILGLIYVSTMMTPQYTATGSVSMKVNTNTTILNTITEIARSTNVAELALLSLEEDDVALLSGEEITVDYIRGGVSASYVATSLNVTVKFVSEEQESSIEILNAVLDATVAYANTNYTEINNNLILGEYAASAVYTGQSKTLILAIAILLGGILGVGVGLMTDLLSGKILFETDVKQLGIRTFHSVRKQNDNEAVLKSQVIDLQNQLESEFIKKPLQMIGFVSINEKLDIDQTMKYMAIQYAANNYKTLVIDLDLEAPSIHKTFGVADDLTVTDILENKYFQKPIFKKNSENLYVLPAKKSTYSSRLLKSSNFDKLIASIKEEFDFILVKLSSYELNDSSFVVSNFLDCYVINVQTNETKKEKLISYINVLYTHKFENVFVNVLEYKKSIMNSIGKIMTKK